MRFNARTHQFKALMRKIVRKEKTVEFTHVAVPVKVKAAHIVDIAPHSSGFNVALSDGRSEYLSAEQCARFTPGVGDYVVTQEDGYVYANPKHVFERKYRPILDIAEAPPSLGSLLIMDPRDHVGDCDAQGKAR